MNIDICELISEGAAVSAAGSTPEFIYESTCSSDGMRITKSQKVFGLAVCPSSELKTAVVTSEGKLLIWELRDEMVSVS